MPYLLIGLYTTLGVVFGVSAASKIVGREAFAASLRPLRLIPERLVRPVAFSVTAVETVVALGLGWAILAEFTGGPAGRAAGSLSLLAAAVLLSVLTTGIVLALRRGVEAKCACFGVTEQPLGVRQVVRNGVLLAAALLGLVVLSTGTGGATAAGSLVGVAAGGLVALIAVRLDDLVELFAPAGPASSPRS